MTDGSTFGDMLAAIHKSLDLIARNAERRQIQIQQGIDFLWTVYGIRAYRGRDSIVIAESDLHTLQAAFVDKSATRSLDRSIAADLARIPIVTAPDWTLDPLHVAKARLIATIAIALHFRTIVRWLDRHLPKGHR